MTGALHLAWRYLAYHKIKTCILVGSITLILFLPAGLDVVIRQGSESLSARAAATPLLIGARGSALDLTLNSLYFESNPPEAMGYGEVERVATSGLARPIPLHARFHARGHPIVGTTLDYFAFRDLEVAVGRGLALLGECVVGARVAAALGLTPGDTVISSPENVFDLGGNYPLEMRVVGVLAPSNAADDGAIFVDLKTTWVIEGIGHGHQDLAAPEANGAVLSRDEEKITANASVVEYNRIEAGNIDSFHFHGDLSKHPVTALIAAPADEKSRVLLMGRYEGADERVQIVRPIRVMEELLETVVTIQGYAVAAIGIVGVATAATATLVFLLSLRLRRREIETLVKIGGARGSVAIVIASEILGVLLLGSLAAAILTLAASQLGPWAMRALLLS